MATNRRDSVEEQSQDLCQCCICFEQFDSEEHKPKFIACHHTICSKCLTVEEEDFENYLLDK